MKRSKNYNMYLPEKTEFYDVEDMNRNTEIIDEELKKIANAKVDKVLGKELSTNDYTNEEKSKLKGIAEGAKVNVQSDWASVDKESDAYIKNKPIACVQYEVNSPGWYRIAYHQYTTSGSHNGYEQDPKLSCKIFIKRSYANYQPEVHSLYLKSVGTVDFIRILSGGNTRVVTKLRLVYSKVTGRHYLDFYYNAEKFNWVQFNISDNLGTNNSEVWNVYDEPQLVTETDSILLKEIDISQEFSVNYRSGRQITFDGEIIKLADFCSLISDWNDVTKNGWYMAANAANAPTEMTGWYYGIVIAHNENYVRQILYHFGNGDIIMSAACDRYERIKHNGTWGKWVNTSYRNLLPTTGGIITGSIVMDGAFSHLRFKTFSTSGGNARGMSFYNIDDTLAGGIGAYAGEGTRL